MKNRMFLIFLITTFFLLFGCSSSQEKNGSSLVPVSENADPFIPDLPKEKQLENKNTPVPYYNAYTVNLDVNPALRMISGIEKVKYKNTTGKSLNELYMNVYLNAFSQKCDYIPYLEEAKETLFPYGIDYSMFQINSLTINDEPVSYSLNNTVLNLKLQKPLAAEEETEIVIVFECYIPKISTRFGANNASLWAGSFLPTIAPYNEKNGWAKSYYYPIGDPFQNTISNYEVTLTTPEGYRIAATGTGTQSERNGKNIAVVSAKMVRDFAFSCSNQYKKASIETKEGIPIHIYYYNEHSKNISQLLNAAKNNLEFYTQYIGSYPYTELDIVESDLYYEGDMEFPQFVLLDSSYFETEKEIAMTSFTFGFQWFSHVINTDSVNESWLTQGLTGFMQSYIYYDPKELDKIMISEYELLKEVLKTVKYPSLNNSLSAYEKEESFYHVQYRRARLMIYSLYKKMGDENFRKLLNEYYTAFSFKTITSSDFLSLCEKVYGKNLDEFFEDWIFNETMPKL